MFFHPSAQTLSTPRPARLKAAGGWLRSHWDVPVLGVCLLCMAGIIVQHCWQSTQVATLRLPNPSFSSSAIVPNSLLACPVPVVSLSADASQSLLTTTATSAHPRSRKRLARKRHAKKPALTGPVALNTASAATFQQLPGIGPTLSQRIVQYRQAHGPFVTVDDLVNVSGIGPKTLAKLKAHLIL